MFYGRGAGKLPTASAVVGDIIDVAQHLEKRRENGWDEIDESFLKDAAELESRWYVRAKVSKSGAEAVFGEIYVIGEDKAAGELAFITPFMREKEVAAKTGNMEEYSRIRVMD